MAAPAVGRIEAGTVEVDGIRTFFRRLPGEGVPTLFVHGNPTHSQDWVPFLQHLSGPGIALDLPGWGRSARPPDFDYTMDGLARFVGRFLERLEVGEHRLVVHDWGSVALIDAQRHPERLRALVVINAVPLLPGYRWHWVARWFWRVPGLGEAFNATATRPALRLLSRQSSPRPGPLPDEHLDTIWEHWDRGTSRAVLALYRSADPGALAAAGEGLGRLDCPALVVWGDADRYLPARFGRAFAERLPRARLLAVPEGGHWPWLERPELVERVAEFLSES